MDKLDSQNGWSTFYLNAGTFRPDKDPEKPCLDWLRHQVAKPDSELPAFTKIPLPGGNPIYVAAGRESYIQVLSGAKVLITALLGMIDRRDSLLSSYESRSSGTAHLKAVNDTIQLRRDLADSQVSANRHYNDGLAKDEQIKALTNQVEAGQVYAKHLEGRLSAPHTIDGLDASKVTADWLAAGTYLDSIGVAPVESGSLTDRLKVLHGWSKPGHNHYADRLHEVQSLLDALKIPAGFILDRVKAIAEGSKALSDSVTESHNTLDYLGIQAKDYADQPLTVAGRIAIFSHAHNEMALQLQKVVDVLDLLHVPQRLQVPGGNDEPLPAYSRVKLLGDQAAIAADQINWQTAMGGPGSDTTQVMEFRSREWLAAHACLASVGLDAKTHGSLADRIKTLNQWRLNLQAVAESAEDKSATQNGEIAQLTKTNQNLAAQVNAWKGGELTKAAATIARDRMSKRAEALIEARDELHTFLTFHGVPWAREDGTKAKVIERLVLWLQHVSDEMISLRTTLNSRTDALLELVELKTIKSHLELRTLYEGERATLTDAYLRRKDPAWERAYASVSGLKFKTIIADRPKTADEVRLMDTLNDVLTFVTALHGMHPQVAHAAVRQFLEGLHGTAQVETAWTIVGQHSQSPAQSASSN